jgi:AAA domain
MSTTAQDLLSPAGTDVEETSAPVGTPPPSVLTQDTVAGLKVTKPASEGYINMLLYGEPGIGKTRLAGSSVVIPEMSPVLLIDFEGGTLSLSGDYGDVDVVRALSWGAVDKLYGSLYDKNPYNTIILDSLTEVQKFCMSEIMKAVVKKDSERDPDIASLREWGKQGEQLRRLVRALRDLPCNTIFTALHHEQTNDAGKVIKTRPGLPGQLKGEVAGYVDIVAYMYKKEVRVGPDRTIKTLMLTQGTDSVVAKDRSGKLPAIMEAPTMRDIYEAINGKRVA